MRRKVWVMAVALFVVGDMVTTWIGLGMGLVEGNGFALSMMEESGMVGLFALKVVAVGLFAVTDETHRFVYERYTEREYFPASPMAGVFMGGFLTLWNSFLICLLLFA